MDPDLAADYLIDDAGDIGDGSDCELSCAIESLCATPPSSGMSSGLIYAQTCSIEQTNTMSSLDVVAYGNTCTTEQANTRKRAMDEECSRPKSKACREKMRRDKLNVRFLELSSVLDPGRPPKSDKATILRDAACVLEQLKAEVQELKVTNEKLVESIKELKAEKNELRDEKIRLKADKERLEQQVKTISMPPTGFIPHPLALHPAAMAALSQPPANKASPMPLFPAVPMWQWLPPTVVDTAQDAKLWSPNA